MIVALDARLDRLERPWLGWRRYGWSLWAGSRLVPGLSRHPWGALGRVLSYRAEPDDLFELNVDVWRHEATPLAIDATVDVGCFCAVNHTMHTVAEAEWQARSDVEVRDGLAAAVSALEHWVGLDLDPDGWRARAGLPARPGPVTR